ISRSAPQVAAPTMLIAGAHDATIPPHAVAMVAAAIPDSQLVTLDCGHVMTCEKPDEVVERITEYAPASRGGQPQQAHSQMAADQSPIYRKNTSLLKGKP